MNEIRLIVRFATKPEEMTNVKGEDVVKCKFQALDEDENYITLYMKLQEYMFFFGTFDIVLTDSYYIEAHFSKCVEDEEKKKALFEIKIDRIINTTEGRFGDKTLENVRRKSKIRSVSLSEVEDMSVVDEKVNKALKKKNPEKLIDEIIKVAQQSTERLINEKNVTSEKLKQRQEKELEDIKPDSHNLLPEQLEKEEKAKSQKQQKKIVKEEVGVVLNNANSEDDLPMGDSDEEMEERLKEKFEGD